MITFFVDISFHKTEIYNPDSMLGVFVVRFVTALAHENVIKFQIVVREPCFMDQPQLVEDLDAHFDSTA